MVDFRYVRTWAGFVHVAFVIDALALRIVGWKVSTSATASFVLDALEQAIHARRPSPEDGLIHHGDRGVQYLAMNYTQRLAEAKLVPSVGSVGDSYDNALAETINGLYKAAGYLAAAVMAERLGGGDGHAALGQLVRQRPPLRFHRLHRAGRGRSQLPCCRRQPRYGRMTRTKLPPENPGRFSFGLALRHHRHGGVIAVQAFGGEHMRLDLAVDRLRSTGESLCCANRNT